MKSQQALKKLQLGLALSVLMIATVDGAQANVFQMHRATAQSPSLNSAPSTPELVAADAKVDASKDKLDKAHKQLEIAKAMVRAAEAEFRAAKADKEALALRTDAQQLADASAVDGKIQGGQNIQNGQGAQAAPVPAPGFNDVPTATDLNAPNLTPVSPTPINVAPEVQPVTLR